MPSAGSHGRLPRLQDQTHHRLALNIHRPAVEADPIGASYPASHARRLQVAERLGHEPRQRARQTVHILGDDPGLEVVRQVAIAAQSGAPVGVATADHHRVRRDAGGPPHYLAHRIGKLRMDADEVGQHNGRIPPAALGHDGLSLQGRLDGRGQLVPRPIARHCDPDGGSDVAACEADSQTGHRKPPVGGRPDRHRERAANMAALNDAWDERCGMRQPVAYTNSSASSSSSGRLTIVWHTGQAAASLWMVTLRPHRPHLTSSGLWERRTLATCGGGRNPRRG